MAVTAAEPLIEFNFLSDERDLRRLMLGARAVADLAASDGVRRDAEYRYEDFPELRS